MKKQIIHFGQPQLRQKTVLINAFNKKLHQLIDSMKQILKDTDDGAALAAPQIGLLKKIVVVDFDGDYLELINPEIIEHSGNQTGFEGCLSFPGYYGEVTRFDFVKVRYFDRYGNKQIIEENGFYSRCFQHEIDHLDGILFIDRMQKDHLIHYDTDQTLPLEYVKELANSEKADLLK